MKFLSEDIHTLEALKKAYHKQAMQLHPDSGGNEQDMQLLNQEYDYLFKRVKYVHVNKQGEFYKKNTQEVTDDFKDLIANLAILRGIRLEVIGSFVWVSGDTKPHKSRLRELGFKWHRIKRYWYLPPEGYRRFGKKSYSMDEIRNMYGVAYDNTIFHTGITG